MYAQGDHSHLVIGLANTDAQVRRIQTIEAETKLFSEIATALASKYEVIYSDSGISMRNRTQNPQKKAAEFAGIANLMYWHIKTAWLEVEVRRENA